MQVKHTEQVLRTMHQVAAEEPASFSSNSKGLHLPTVL